MVAPKIKDLISKHRRRPIGARVTLTSGTLDVKRIFRHLTEEVGFQEIGFAPATTAPKHDYSITDEGFDTLLGQFRELAEEFLEAAVENRHHAFSNVKETLGEIHKGMSKAYPCGAGLGLMGVATDGDVALCHRFAGSDAHKLGTVADGIDRDGAALVSREASHRREDRLQQVLGAADLLGRLLSRGAHAPRRHDESEPALLRVDSRMDGHLPEGVRGALRAKPGVSHAVRSRRSPGAGVLRRHR